MTKAISSSRQMHLSTASQISCSPITISADESVLTNLTDAI